MKLRMTAATNQHVEDHVLARLPFVSPPGQRIEDDVLVKLRGLGGPGSGNFGHAGRPGEVGGSSSSQAKWESSLTDREREEISAWTESSDVANSALLGQAFKNAPPFIGTIYRGISLEKLDDLQDVPLSVGSEFMLPEYFSASKRQDVGLNFARDDRGDPDAGVGVLLKIKSTSAVDISNLSVDVWKHQEEVVLRRGSRYRVTDVSIPTKTSRVDFEGKPTRGSVLVSTVTLEEITNKFRAAGGPGSGNFGHAGRPGEVGGSAPSGEVLYKTFLDRKLPGFAGDYDPVYYSALYGAHQQMIHESFESRSGEGVETLMAIHKIPEGGRRVPISPIVVGDVGQVFVPPEMRARWNTDPPIAVAHTHPSSAAPSLQDLKMAVGRYDQNQIPKTVVFGKDGSWHELTITEPLSADDFKLAARIHDREYNGAQDRAVKKTDAWISNQTGWTNISPRTFETPEGRITFQSSDDPLAQKKFGKDRLMLKHFEHFAQESPEIWKKVSAAVPKLKYRYYRPDKS